ncbi:deoxyribonuclease-2-alpha [Heteronotia binoei]|uniref:deoxyribonuclease-2-alpha n=1 Tax=Heteronotia binoei TaxID=13085 RepID=UPI00292F8658|nr:deoxyribonuclease-2-alpha [Heteronotia binoei]
MLRFLLVALILACCSPARGGISCYDDSGQPVDWFIVYKLPKSHHRSSAEGMRYMYQDGHTQGWVEGQSLMNSTEGAVGRTLQQLYMEAARRQEAETAHVLYNDEPPGELTSSKGHTKGVIFLDSAQGFWLLHSTPHFPDLQTNYSWPRSGLPNGQSFLCVTFPYSQFKEIGRQLLFTDPLVYDYRVEGSFAEDLPALLNASKGCHVQQEPWNSSITLTSLEGKEFISFAKFGRFGDDLYSGWLTEALASNLYAEFWLRSRGILPSNCSGPFHVYNVEAVAFQEPGPAFSTMVDHSKWCVATESDPGWACVGDMNRNRAEEWRGGGTLCLRDPAVWKAFYSLVQKYADCRGAGEAPLSG